MKLTEQDVLNNLELFYKYSDAQNAVNKKYMECKHLPKQQQTEYMKESVLNLLKIGEELNSVINAIFSSMTFLEYVKRIAAKSTEIYAKKFELLYANFLQKINDCEYFGLKKDEIYFSETITFKILFANERNILLSQISNEKMEDVVKKVEYYISILNLETADEKDIEEKFEHFLNPTPNDYTEMDENPILDNIGLEKLVERADKLSTKLKFLIQSIAQELIVLSFQKEYFNKLKLLKKELNIDEVIDNDMPVSVEKSKLGRKPVEKIEIPKPPERKKGMKWTIFSMEETAKLFSYLAQLNCVFNQKEYMSKDSFSKAIQVLTGYSAATVEEYLLYEKLIPKNMNESKKIAENIKDLIISKL